MSKIGAFEATNSLDSLMDRVERGEGIVITRHGKPVARLVPTTGRIDQAQAAAAFDRIRTRAAAPSKKRDKTGGLDWRRLKKLRDEGRP